MAIYHKSNNQRVKVGDTVVRAEDGVTMLVRSMSEYTHKGARLWCSPLRRNPEGPEDFVSWKDEQLCSEVGCFHSTGDSEVFNQ